MESSKILKLLLALPPNELNEFGRYLKTDFFNRKEILVRLFADLSAFVKGKRQNLSKKALFRKYFPEELPDLEKLSPSGQEKRLRKRMDNLSYELRLHLENYLVWKQSLEKGHERESLLLAAYESRRADDFFFDQYEKMLQALQEEKPLPILNHLIAYRLIQTAHEYPGFKRWERGHTHVADMQAHLDTYHLVSKLMNASVQLLADLMVNIQSEIPMLEAYLELGRQEPFCNHLFVSIYCLFINDLRLRSFNRETAAILRERILPELEGRPHSEQVGLFNLLLNYHVLVSQFSEDDIRKSHFELQKLGLENGYILRNGSIPYADFLNIVGQAADIGELSWAEDFIENYGATLMPEIRESTVLLGLSKVKMAAGKFEEAIAVLNRKQKFTSSVDKVMDRIQRIKCYYELDDNDLLESWLESSRKQNTRSNGLGEPFREQFHQFLLITRRLYLLRHKQAEPDGLFQVLEQLRTKKFAMAQDWLEKKAKDLYSETYQR